MKYKNVIKKIIATIIMILVSMMIMNNSVLATAGITSAIGDALNENITDLDRFINQYGLKNMTQEQVDEKLDALNYKSGYRRYTK